MRASHKTVEVSPLPDILLTVLSICLAADEARISIKN